MFNKFISKKEIRAAIIVFILVFSAVELWTRGGGFNFSSSSGSKRGVLTSYAVPLEGVGPVDVVQVVDGDTIVVDIQNQDVTVRLLGLDTPETVKPNTPVACYGEDASEYTKALLTGRHVRLQGDPTQDRVDRYGRTLAYVWRDDGLFINQDLVANGFAREYTYKKLYQYQSLFRSLETSAQSAHRGLWNPLVCPFGSFPSDTKQ